MNLVEECIASGDTRHYQKSRSLKEEWRLFVGEQIPSTDLAKDFINGKLCFYGEQLPSLEIVNQWRRAIVAESPGLCFAWWKVFTNGYADSLGIISKKFY